MKNPHDITDKHVVAIMAAILLSSSIGEEDNDHNTNVAVERAVELLSKVLYELKDV